MDRPPDDPALVEPRERPLIAFIGGTGRSGTHVIAQLLGRHRRFALVRVESRFHVNPQGFPDLLEGKVTPEEFAEKLRSFWWRRIPAGRPFPALLPRLSLGRGSRGLHKIMPPARFEQAVSRFEAGVGNEPLEVGARRLFLDLLWPIAEDEGCRGLVEMSTHSVARAPMLAKLFPESKLIHIVRDGRDAGASKAGRRQKAHHPRDVVEGVEWWLERLTRAERSVAAAPDGYVLTLSLDELTIGDRDAEYERLRSFLGGRDARAMRAFFERKMNAENAHRGRWQHGLDREQRDVVVAAYEGAIVRLEAEGLPSGALLRRVYERFG